VQSFGVLVIDSDPVSRHACATIFGELGCRVQTASNGWEALRRLAVQGFDIVCLDPGPAGAAAGEVLAALREDQLIVALTASPGDLAARYSGVIAKPVTRASAVVTIFLATMSSSVPSPAPAPARRPAEASVDELSLAWAS